MSTFFRLRLAWVLAAACLGACQSGCVRRRMTIRSDPPGAVVFVDDYEIGTTPVSANFTYYGTRKIRLVKDGYETRTVMQSIPAPWYQIAPLDFFSENLVPGEIRDRREFNYQLWPQRVVPTEQLLGQAEALRERAQSAGFFRASGPPPGAFAPPPGVPGGYPTPGVPPGGGMPVRPLPTGGWRGAGSGEWGVGSGEWGVVSGEW